MDIGNDNFYKTLPNILNDIRQSSFVAIDLELSGVPLKQTRAGGRTSGKQTLQQRYEQIKDAAEKYQILQIGLTFVGKDNTSGRYVCKPYNIPISPLVHDSGIELERDVLFSSSAATFLRSVAFDFSQPFDDGVPYLTGSEETLARERFKLRHMKARSSKIDIKDSDVEALAFLDKTRRSIKEWLESKAAKKDEYLNIGPPALQQHGDDTVQQPEMGKYQKWLVHQVVEVEFPELKSLGKRGFVQIIRLDQNEAALFASKRQADLDHRIARQKGFGWIIVALLGRALPVESLASLVHEASSEESEPSKQKSLNRRLRQLADSLHSSPSVVVGHNCFLDLIYLYHNFIAPLPVTVSEFAAVLHEAFPLVIDTKYMATHNCGDIPPHSSLEDLVHRLLPKTLGEQIDEVNPAFDKYIENDCYHEAGYDSLMTAQVAIRLSCQLEAAGTYIDEAEDGGVRLSATPEKAPNVVAKVVDKSVSAINTTLASLGLHTKEQPPPSTSSTDVEERSVANTGAVVQDMPKFDSDFWRVYGNRLRVFGTEEGVCNIEGISSSLAL